MTPAAGGTATGEAATEKACCTPQGVVSRRGTRQGGCHLLLGFLRNVFQSEGQGDLEEDSRQARHEQPHGGSGRPGGRLSEDPACAQVWPLPA